MIKNVKVEHPGYKVLLTPFSPSGYGVWKNYKGVDATCYFPLGTPFWVKKSLNLASPAITILIKYEL